jgi:hypothetical protein
MRQGSPKSRGPAATGRGARSGSSEAGSRLPSIGSELFIITLKSSTTPIALEALKSRELQGLVVFHSRQVQDRQERFRLHLGYFETEAAANRALEIVRQQYPQAWVGPAPKTGMGSLDDTGIAKFRVLRPVVAEPAEPAPRAPVASAPVAQATTVRSLRSAPRPMRTAEPASPLAVPGLSRAATARPAPAPAQAPAPAVAPREKRGAQYYAVQLVWSLRPVDRRRVAKLAIFAGYRLYEVQTTRDDRRWYGLRLGFFRDGLSARLVAQYARSDFKDSAVVPVSLRERERSAQAESVMVEKDPPKQALARAPGFAVASPATAALPVAPVPAAVKPPKSPPPGQAPTLGIARGQWVPAEKKPVDSATDAITVLGGNDLSLLDP